LGRASGALLIIDSRNQCGGFLLRTIGCSLQFSLTALPGADGRGRAFPALIEDFVVHLASVTVGPDTLAFSAQDQIEGWTELLAVLEELIEVIRIAVFGGLVLVHTDLTTAIEKGAAFGSRSVSIAVFILVAAGHGERSKEHTGQQLKIAHDVYRTLSKK